MQLIQETQNMWLYDSITEIDLKINKALHRAKRSVMQEDRQRMISKEDINAAGQEAITADILSERIFLKSLEDEGLSGTVFSEESGVKTFGNPEEGDFKSLTMLLDPLDGSQNYLKGLPIGCISVAYGAYQKDPVLKDLTKASLMNLYNEEVYFVNKGNGAYFNGSKLPTIEDMDLIPYEERNIQISYYAYGAEASKYYFDFQELYTLRSLGSAAWELAMVAENRNDAFADIRGVLKLHDLAGARLILNEVGGKMIFLSLDEEEIRELPLNQFKKGYSVIAALDKDLLKFLLDDFKRHGLLNSSISL